MIVFKKIRDPDNRFDTSDITFESQAVTLSEVIEDFQDFMKACGYHSGTCEQIGIIDEIEDIKEEE